MIDNILSCFEVKNSYQNLIKCNNFCPKNMFVKE